MADINTNNSSNTNTETTKSKQELKQEERDRKAEQKVEAMRLRKIAKLEKRKARNTTQLQKIKNPWYKGVIQERIDKIDAKIIDLKESKNLPRPFSLVMTTWSKGLAKESKRITWHNKRDMVKDFVTVILVCAFLAIIFFIIDMIVISMH